MIVYFHGIVMHLHYMCMCMTVFYAKQNDANVIPYHTIPTVMILIMTFHWSHGLSA
jgi:hypothetical protein